MTMKEQISNHSIHFERNKKCDKMCNKIYEHTKKNQWNASSINLTPFLIVRNTLCGDLSVCLENKFQINYLSKRFVCSINLAMVRLLKQLKRKRRSLKTKTFYQKFGSWQFAFQQNGIKCKILYVNVRPVENVNMDTQWTNGHSVALFRAWNRVHWFEACAMNLYQIFDCNIIHKPYFYIHPLCF